MFTDQPSISVPSSDHQQALDAALASFASHPPLVGEVSGSNFLGIPNDITIVNEEETPDVQETETTGTAQTSEDAETTEEVTEENDPEEPEISEGFAAEFKKTFGLEPTEAIETFNQLIAFRDEVRLMGEWNVTPAEYQSRMSEIREFYKSLPEEGQDQFNSVEGAVAIWNHLNKQKPTTKTSVKAVAKTTSKPKNVKPTYKRSEINRMPQNEYRQRVGEINRAFLEGRIIEDV